MNRIRQLCQKGDTDHTISKQALVVITRATELFVQDLAGVCVQIAKMQKRKTMHVNDIMSAAGNIDKFHFI
jgi:histone H3/H4